MKQESHFDAVAKDWDNRPGARERAEVFAAAIRREIALTGTMSLLEFGCGTGLVSLPFGPLVHSIRMVDTSRGMLDVLEAKVKQGNIRNVEALFGDLFDPSLRDKSFDLIYSLLTLHHVPDTAELLARVHRLLRPGGRLCLADLETEDGSFHGPEAEVHRGFDTQQLKTAVETAGFQVTALERLYVLKKPDSQGQVREYPLFFIAARSV